LLLLLKLLSPVEPGTQENVAVAGGCKVAPLLLRHALVPMNARESVVLVVEFLARSKARFVVVVLV
jgi:hypothetical protein